MEMDNKKKRKKIGKKEKERKREKDDRGNLAHPCVIVSISINVKLL